MSAKGLRPQGAFGVYDMVREDTFWLDKAVTGTRISTVTPASLVIFAGEQDNLTAACSGEKRAKGEKCHDRPI
jgi:hypothetical protein